MATVITMGDNVISAIAKLAEGNPGAARVLAELVKVGAGDADPDNALGEWSPLLNADTVGLRGPDFWVLYKDVFGHDAVKTYAALRASQLGLLPISELVDAARDQSRAEDGAAAQFREKYGETVVGLVRGRLPRFAPGVDTETPDAEAVG